ncbi:ABC transporter substrate-binding protein [Segnochrobactrum spirostomi]|nr:ABC transporter substrate-binding protein [Segnochrobactrum spirostomi]
MNGSIFPMVNRRRLLQLSAAGTALTVLQVGFGRGAFADTGPALTWISPRGYVETPDDFHYRIAEKLGFFGDLKVEYLAGPQDGTASVKFVDQGQAQLGAPSPGVFALGVDHGLDIAFFFAKHPVDIFSFAFRKGQAVKDPRELAGKTVLLGSIGWKPIVDAEVAQVGVDPATVNSVEAGAGWAQALAAGNGDAALVWEGLRSQWAAQGLDFDYLSLVKTSKFPANGEILKKSSLADPAKRQLYADYARGLAKGYAFAYANPRAAAAIVDEAFPSIAGKGTPEERTEYIVQLSNTTRGPYTDTKGWGYQHVPQYQEFFDIALKIGTISKPIDASKVVLNDVVPYANEFDKAALKAQAEAYPLPDAYKAVDIAAIRARNPVAYP